jgi:hypothetical protein
MSRSEATPSNSVGRLSSLAATRELTAAVELVAQQVAFPGLIHNAPSVDPAAFTAVLFEFISKRQGV